MSPQMDLAQTELFKQESQERLQRIKGHAGSPEVLGDDDADARGNTMLFSCVGDGACRAARGLLLDDESSARPLEREFETLESLDVHLLRVVRRKRLGPRLGVEIVAQRSEQV